MTNGIENNGFTAAELIKELEDQRHAERVLNERLKEARKLGDLSDNPVYDQTREELSKVWARIDEIKDILKKMSGSDSENIIQFGRYPQGADGEVKPVEWQVLEIDGSKALLISRYGLDAKQYNSKNEDVTWDKCSLRAWLNNEFLNKAFTAEEQEKILMTAVKNPENPRFETEGGADTEDKVFLLSIEEANEYFDTGEARRVKPTEYAKANGCYEDEGYCWWWLRSPGFDQRCAADVYSDGNVVEFGNYVSSDINAVRPAIWINLES